MQTITDSRAYSRAKTLAGIQERAAHITDEYRLVWDLFEKCFMVAHKEDRKRRYRISAQGCTCPSRANYGTCKHQIGLPDLARVEIDRYTLLGWHEQRSRIQELLTQYLNTRRAA